MAKTMIRYDGLSKRETYDEILGYLERGGGAGIDVAFPNRQASFIRNSPQYQNILTLDFVDLQKQQENMLKQQKRDVIVKEQASDSSMKSVLASESSSMSSAEEAQASDLSALSRRDTELKFEYESYDDFLNELEEDKEYKIKVRGQQLVKDHLKEVKEQHEHLGGLRDAFRAAQTTGTQDYSGTTGSKLLEKAIAKNQQSDRLRVLPRGQSEPPPYIAEISKDPKNKGAVERKRLDLGLSPDPQTQAASSSSGATQYYSLYDEGNPETNVAPKGKSGRPVNPNSARQKAMAKRGSSLFVEGL